MAPLFCAFPDGIFSLGLLLRLLFRVTISKGLGLLLGLLFRLLECMPEIGNYVINESKCRFSSFSERKNDTRLCDIPYYNKINPLIYSVFTSLLQVKSFKGVCVRPFLAFCRGMRVPLRRTCWYFRLLQRHWWCVICRIPVHRSHWCWWEWSAACLDLATCGGF